MPSYSTVPDIPGWLTEEEGAALAELAKGKIVLEMGSYLGRSTVTLARVASVVHAVDWHRGDQHVGRHETLMGLLLNLADHGVRDKVIVHVGRFEQVLPLFGKHFDLVFIDGAHKIADVKRDTALALACLASGGVIAWHDYGVVEHADVQAAVDDMANDRGWTLGRAGTLAWTLN